MKLKRRLIVFACMHLGGHGKKNKMKRNLCSAKTMPAYFNIVIQSFHLKKEKYQFYRLNQTQEEGKKHGCLECLCNLFNFIYTHVTKEHIHTFLRYDKHTSHKKGINED